MNLPLADLDLPLGLARKFTNAGMVDTDGLRVLTTRNLMSTFLVSDRALDQINAALAGAGEQPLPEPVERLKRVAGPRVPGRCPKEVGEAVCNRARYKNKRSCIWHWLLEQPIAVQTAHADERLTEYDFYERPHRARVPEREWPAGQRWCSGCQSFIPVFYCQGSRCHACASRASHRSMIARVYDLTGEQYEQLLKWQGGRCYFCQRVPRSKRLAVDHDHESGLVRGLLCADDERGCNAAILGNIRSLAMAQRIVAYLEKSPMERVADGEPPPRLDNTRRQTQEAFFERPPASGPDPFKGFL